MFVRIKKSGKYQYLQVVENRRLWPSSKQFVIGNMGRFDKYKKDDNLQHVILSLIKLKMKIKGDGVFKKSPKKRTHRKP